MPTHRPSFRRLPPGFTLVEALAAIVVLSVLGSTAFYLVLNAADGYLEAATTAQLHSELSLALDNIVRDLRAIPLDSSAASLAPDIDDTNASTVMWGGGGDFVSLFGSDLKVWENGAARVLMKDVTSFVIQPYDESGAAIGPTLSGAACDPIRKIAVTITAQRSGVTATVSTHVFVRSTMIGAG